jgi:PleD family two-component response regulator
VPAQRGTSLRAGYGIAERVSAATARESFTLTPGGCKISITVSAGLAESANDSHSGLLRRADMDLYRSKQDGRNRVSVDCAGPAIQEQMPG